MSNEKRDPARKDSGQEMPDMDSHPLAARVRTTKREHSEKEVFDVAVLKIPDGGALRITAYLSDTAYSSDDEHATSSVRTPIGMAVLEYGTPVGGTLNAVADTAQNNQVHVGQQLMISVVLNGSIDDNQSHTYAIQYSPNNQYKNVRNQWIYAISSDANGLTAPPSTVTFMNTEVGAVVVAYAAADSGDNQAVVISLMASNVAIVTSSVKII